MKRYALITTSQPYQVAAYMPGNYTVLAVLDGQAIIEGEDVAGWTLHDYVLPRLASGLHFGEEIDLSHPLMKLVPDSARWAT